MEDTNMPQEKAKFPFEIKLPSGKTAVVKEFKGRDCMKAQRIAGTDGEKYIPALIAMTTTIDDQPIVAEDLEEMYGPDFLALFSKFSEVAFI